jgi:hypothetical protein
VNRVSINYISSFEIYLRFILIFVCFFLRIDYIYYYLEFLNFFLLYNKSINIIPIIIRLDLLEIACLFLLVFLISSSSSENLIPIIISRYFCLVSLSFWFFNIILEIYVLEKSTNYNYISLAQTISAAKKTELLFFQPLELPF